MYVLKKITGYIIYDDNIIKRINIILKATKDGLLGNIGKSIDPKYWSKKIKN